MKQSLIKKHSISDIVKLIGDTPQKDDNLHVHISKNRFEEIPFQYPFRSDDYGFLLILKGELKVQLNLIEHTIEERELIALKPQTVTQVIAMSDDLEVAGISFTVDFLLKNSFKKTEFEALDFFTANNIPKLKLSKEEVETVVSLSKILEKNNSFYEEDIPFRKEIVQRAFGLLLYHYGSLFKKKYPDIEADLSRQEALTLRFFKVLNDNFKNERTVKFYADVLCVTPGHLSKVLKSVTGKTANQLIDETIILEAKILLNNPALSIAEVAEELQFSDQSFFGKFFKKHTGYSPSSYRKKH